MDMNWRCFCLFSKNAKSSLLKYAPISNNEPIQKASLCTKTAKTGQIYYSPVPNKSPPRRHSTMFRAAFSIVRAVLG